MRIVVVVGISEVESLKPVDQANMYVSYLLSVQLLLLLVSREERRVTKMTEGISVIVMLMLVGILEAIDGDQIALLVRHNIFTHAQASLSQHSYEVSVRNEVHVSLQVYFLLVGCRREISKPSAASQLIDHHINFTNLKYVRIRDRRGRGCHRGDRRDEQQRHRKVGQASKRDHELSTPYERARRCYEDSYCWLKDRYTHEFNVFYFRFSA